MSLNRRQQIDYTMRYQIRSGRVNFADYVVRRQLIQDGELLGLQLFPPDHDASIIPIIQEAAANTTVEEYNSYLQNGVEVPESNTTTATVPNPPTSLVATSIVGGVSISFTPGSDGGSPITNYEYYPVDLSGASWTPLSPPKITSPVTIPDILSPGTYRYELRAVNAVGVSADSAPVSVVIPNLPNAPTLTYLLPGDGEAYVYFTPGSGTITNYEYTTDSGSTTTPLTPPDILSPVKVSPLSNGSPATIGLYAINSGGSSVISNQLPPVTPANNSVPAAWLLFDPANPSSYSGSGATVSNVGSYGALNGTKNVNVLYVDGTGLSPTRKVFDFSGTNGHNITFGAFNFGTTITISAWVYPRLQSSINGILTNTGANIATAGFKVGWNSWMSTDKRMLFEGGNGAAGNVPTSVDNTVVMNEWQYLTYAFDQVNQRIIMYRNGVPVDTAVISTVAGVTTSTTNFNIGSYVGGLYAMDAQLGLLKVFNSILDASQVLADFNATKATFGL